MNVVYRCEIFERRDGELQPDGVIYTMTEFRMKEELARLVQTESKITCGEVKLAIVGATLVKKIHNNEGVFATIQGDDPNYYGLFAPRDPKHNIQLYRDGMELSRDQAAHAAEMTGTA